MKATPTSTIHFPTAREKGPFPFPTSQAMAMARQAPEAGEAADEAADEAAKQLSAEDLRLMADTMPGDGPGD